MEQSVKQDLKSNFHTPAPGYTTLLKFLQCLQKCSRPASDHKHHITLEVKRKLFNSSSRYVSHGKQNQQYSVSERRKNATQTSNYSQQKSFLQFQDVMPKNFDTYGFLQSDNLGNQGSAEKQLKQHDYIYDYIESEETANFKMEDVH